MMAAVSYCSWAGAGGAAGSTSVLMWGSRVRRVARGRPAATAALLDKPLRRMVLNRSPATPPRPSAPAMPLRPTFRTAVPLAAALAAGLAAACARKDSGQYTVGFAQMESDNPWRLAQTASLKAEAEKRGYQLVVTDAQGQTAKQVSDVEDLIARRVKVILLAPREYQGLVPALQAARQAKIPVILVDREAAGTPGQDYVTFLGSNFVDQGRRAADWLAKTTNGRATVVELTALDGLERRLLPVDRHDLHVGAGRETGRTQRLDRAERHLVVVRVHGGEAGA